jgi:hypothetical protein
VDNPAHNGLTVSTALDAADKSTVARQPGRAAQEDQNWFCGKTTVGWCIVRVDRSVMCHDAGNPERNDWRCRLPLAAPVTPRCHDSLLGVLAWPATCLGVHT